MAYILDSTPNEGSYMDIGYYNPAYYRQAQSFSWNQIPTITGVEIYSRSNAAANTAACTVAIETDSSNKPSGSLAHANFTATWNAFNDQSFAWRAINFSSASLLNNVKYWLTIKWTTEEVGATLTRWAYGSAYAGHAFSTLDTGVGTWVTTASDDLALRIVGTLKNPFSGDSYAFFL